MSEKQTEALKLALEALEGWGKGFPDNWGDLDTEAVTAIREALAEQPAQQQDLPDFIAGALGVSRGTAYDMMRDALAQQQEPVAHSIVAGALFDFMGWLTSRNECLVLSSTDDAAPAADAIKDFAHMRNLSIDDAKVREWQEHLASPPASKTEQQEPVAWMWRCKPYCDWPNWSISLKRPADSGRDGHKRTEGYEETPLYTSPPAQQQEPVAVVSGYYGGQCVILPIDPARIFNSNTALYTSPPASKPLSVEQIAELDCNDHYKFARAIEAAHKIGEHK